MQDTQPSNQFGQSKASVVARTSPLGNEKCQILAKKGFLKAKNLTSGVTLLLYSQEFQLGVLLQMPSLNASSPADIESDAFARPALALILSEFETLGVSKTDLRVYAVGGSSSDGIKATSGVAVRRALWSYGLVPSACDLGGHQVRSIWMDVENGRTIIRSESVPEGALRSGTPMSVAS